VHWQHPAQIHHMKKINRRRKRSSFKRSKSHVKRQTQDLSKWNVSALKDKGKSSTQLRQSTWSLKKRQKGLNTDHVQIDNSNQKTIPQEEVKLNTTGKRAKETYKISHRSSTRREQEWHTKHYKAQKRANQKRLQSSQLPKSHQTHFNDLSTAHHYQIKAHINLISSISPLRSVLTTLKHKKWFER